MSKAYDRIEWPFLQEVLRCFGFDPIWVDWIMECVSSVSYSFLINGSPRGRVLPSRGIRQGDPLSPYLFILCTEVLSGLCRQAQERGSLPGLKVARNSPTINHLLFADDTMFFCRTDHMSCATLQSILTRYGNASGQMINLLKSTITFSSKTPAEARNRVKLHLHIDKEGGIGKYLGLPEHFGRRKRDIFASIVDRIRQRSHSWTTSFLSGAGKQVLLKAVLAAMPTYAMSCFKIPVSLCKQIQSVFTRFWWDSKPNLKKMSWISWDRLTLPKSAGGLGFREIEKFNEALLAKLAWRILTDPNSLLSRTLLGKYCHTYSFMECSSPSSASHGWRGILAARDVLKKGMGWLVGNGKDINIWTEPWLALDKPTRPTGPPPLNSINLCVQDLFLPNSTSWNISAIRLHLPHHEQDILCLNPSSFGMVDTRVWLPERSGDYSTKTGYALSKLNATPPRDQAFNWNQFVWNVATSPKTKQLLWRIGNNALSVGSNLLARGIMVDGACKRCGAPETILHVLLNCPFASRVWNLLPANLKPSPDTSTTISLLLQNSKKTTCLPPTGVSNPVHPWLFWYLWTSRNKLLFENLLLSEEEVVLRSIKEARAWQEAQVRTCPPTSRPKPTRKSCPTSSVTSGLSCFVDAAWDVRSGFGGMGWLFTSRDTGVIAQDSSNRRFVASALVAETLAVKAALSAAVSSGFRALTIYSDSKTLVTLLTSGGKCVELQGLLHDIHMLCTFLESISFCFVPRSDNIDADSLAKAALFNLSWLASEAL